MGRKQVAGYRIQSTAQNHARDPSSNDFATIVPADCPNPNAAAPDVVSREYQIRNRTWDPASDAIIFATRGGAGNHIQERRPAKPSSKPINFEPEDETFPRVSMAPPLNGSANTSTRANSTKIPKHSAYDRLQRMAILLRYVRATLSNLIASLLELEAYVIKRLGWVSTDIPRDDKDDKATAFKGMRGERTNASEVLGSPVTPELQTAYDAAGNERLGEAHSKSTDDFRLNERPSDLHPEIKGFIVPNLDVPDSQTADTALTPPDQTPHVPFTYKMQLDSKEQSLTASPSSNGAYWHYNLYRGPQGRRVKVHYCRDLDSTEQIAKLFSGHRVLGFDLEWMPQATSHDGIKKNVSLIQLASEECIALFHVGIFQQDKEVDSLVGPLLKEILESAEITKVGVAIKADSARLCKYLGIQSRGLLELSHLHKLVKVSSEGSGRLDKKLVSLSEQVKEHLGMPLSKGSVRCSNWSKPLDKRQVEYAASDAYAALHLYDVLEKKRIALDPTPPRPAHAELNLPIRLAEGVSIPAVDEEHLAIPNEHVEETSPPHPAEVLVKPSEPAVATSVAKLVPTQPYVVLAGAWVSQYRSGIKPPAVVRASTPQLRAYALWHLHQQEIQEIAKLLRDPPLQKSTVATYVLEAVRLQRLAYDIDRLRVVHACLPVSLRGRYQSIFKYKATAKIVGV